MYCAALGAYRKSAEQRLSGMAPPSAPHLDFSDARLGKCSLAGGRWAETRGFAVLADIRLPIDGGICPGRGVVWSAYITASTTAWCSLAAVAAAVSLPYVATLLFGNVVHDQRLVPERRMHRGLSWQLTLLLSSWFVLRMLLCPCHACSRA